MPAKKAQILTNRINNKNKQNKKNLYNLKILLKCNYKE